jgi:hypothetical protein
MEKDCSIVTYEYNGGRATITMISKNSYHECSFLGSNKEKLDEYIGKYYE